MKDPLRSAAKKVFYFFQPALRALWTLIKYVEYFVVHPLLSLLPLRWAHGVFRCRWPWLLLMPSEKELILRNLSIAFQGKLPESQLARIGAAHARFLSSLRFDAWISSSCSAKRLNEAVRFEGLAHIREAQEAGKAVVLLGCHTGYTYRLVFALARNGTKHRVITMKTEKTGRIVWRGKAELVLYRKILERMEREENIRVIYAGSAYREIRESLEEKQVLLAHIDNPFARGVQIRFLGLECVFSGEIFRLAQKHDAVCLPYIVRVDRHFCEIRIYPPWQPEKPAPTVAERILAQAEYFIRLFEGHILSVPEQWWLWRDLGAFQRPRP